MIVSAELVASAASARDFPRDRLPEVALVGRSNVGKSSLINALVRRKLARTSAAPGKTRLANFYRVQRGSEPALYLVDLPGYGYARGGDASAREFDRLTDAYFGRAACGADAAPSRKGAPARLAPAEGPVPIEVLQAYKVEKMEFGRDYIIPKPMDTRLLGNVAAAVAKAAVDSGVARLPYPANYPL